MRSFTTSFTIAYKGYFPQKNKKIAPFVQSKNALVKNKKEIFLAFRCPTVGVECTVLHKYHKYLPTRFRDVNTFFSLKKYLFYSSVFARTQIFILFRKQENTPTGCHENTVSFCSIFENTLQKFLIFF